jgi:hypothetical protein
MRVPGFLVRQFYVSGSLRNAGDGFELQAKNPLGDGALVGIRRVAVDGAAIEPHAVTAHRTGSAEVVSASSVSRATPVMFRKGDAVTFHVAGQPLLPGKHRLELEIIERDAGLLQLSLEDKLADR